MCVLGSEKCTHPYAYIVSASPRKGFVNERGTEKHVLNTYTYSPGAVTPPSGAHLASESPKEPQLQQTDAKMDPRKEQPAN